jgi:hypothetical protein
MTTRWKPTTSQNLAQTSLETDMVFGDGMTATLNVPV